MPTQNYSDYDLYTGEMTAKRPELKRLGCTIFALSVLISISLVFLALFFPATWLRIAVCVIPILIIFGPLAGVIL